MLVGIDEHRATWCADAVSPMLVIRVAHVQAGIERMLVTRPLVVAVRGGLAPGEVQPIREAAHDIGAEVVEVAEFMGESAVVALMKDALARAEEARKTRAH
jgi:hypothetical protein